MKTGITLALAAIGALGGTGYVSGFHVPFISGSYTPPAQCVVWYDGCNMCQKVPDGSTSCTNRICNGSGKGFCRAYATSTPQTATTSVRG
jgi:hypothetical protein